MTARQMDLLLPAPPAPARGFPVEPIVRTALIETVAPFSYRWTAERAWGPGPLIVWVLLNPSTADGRVDDPTMRRMIGFSYRWGFGCLKVMNVYPVIFADPSQMARWRKLWNHEAWEGEGMRRWELDRSPYSAFMHNMRLIERALEAAHGPDREDATLVAAWGAGVRPDDLEFFLENVQLPVDDEEFGRVRVDVTWHCLGRNGDGSPRHPLSRGRNRVPDDAKLQVWKKGARRRNSSDRYC